MSNLGGDKFEIEVTQFQLRLQSSILENDIRKLNAFPKSKCYNFRDNVCSKNSRLRRLVFSDMRPETKGSRFDSGY